MAEFLRKILEKDTIISTASAAQLKTSPKNVANYYSEIASTHMALGDTEHLCKRIKQCLSINKTTFNGAVVGEYGFGKTSLLIYLWHYCIQNQILAVPPYQWSSLADHFNVIYSWAYYKLSLQSSTLAEEFTDIFSKYIDPSVEARARQWAKTHGVTLRQAIDIIKAEVLNGGINLDFSIDDLMSYCREVSEFLQHKTEWKGLLVITDELQQTITELNRNVVYDSLFNITNHLVGGRGNYGFLWGFPATTHADLVTTRADILDRLNSNGVFIRLRQLYDKNFPTHLWDKFCNAFDIDQNETTVVDAYTLQAIGQVCDGDRRDIGNGPRSVISAFKAMVQHYLDSHETYQTEDFVRDCFDGEIKLGENSSFVQRIQNVLDQDDIGNDFSRTIRILGAYPSGIPKKALEEYGLNEELDRLIKHTGGLGKVVVKSITTYMLKVMRPSSDESEDSVLENELRQFYSEYAPDRAYRKKAHIIFNRLLAEVFTNYKGSGANEKWKASNWGGRKGKYTCLLTGSFDSRYPERELILHTSYQNYTHDDKASNDTHLSFYFNFCDEDDTCRVIKKSNSTYQLNLDLSYQEEQLGIHRVNDIIQTEKQSPMLFLCLIDHLENANIPNVEEPDKNHLIEQLTKNIVFNIFNENLLGEVEGSSIELDNQGDYLIQDLFISACHELFPEYVTIIGGMGWKKKIQAYINALNQDIDGLSLMEKRGKEPLVLSSDKNKNKLLIARLFSQAPTNFDSWLSNIKSLVDFKFDSRETYFRFKTHPLEEFLLERIDNKGVERQINGVMCKALTMGKSLLNKMLSKGYLDHEILTIITIGQARKYFNFDAKEKIVYKMPEDKEELKTSCQDFIEIVRKQIETLSVFPEYDSPLEILDELDEKVSSIETREQSEQIIKNLKAIQSNNKHFASKELGNIKIDATNERNKAEKRFENLRKLKGRCKNLQDEISGSSSWIDELLEIRINLNHEICNLETKFEPIIRFFKGLSKKEVLQSKHVIDQFVQAGNSFDDEKRDLEENIEPLVNVIEKKIRHLEKWVVISKSRDRFLKKYFEYSKIIGDELKLKLDELDEKVKTELKENRVCTLENHEQYNAKYVDLRGKLQGKTESLKNEWIEKHKRYADLLKQILGREPEWRLRWENPSQAYNDLYESARKDCQLAIERLDTNLKVLLDDVTYTIEVLNHRKAKEVDSKLRELFENIKEYLETDLTTLSSNEDSFTEFTKRIIQTLTEYADLNREHRRIIKPTPVKNPNEKLLLDLLAKDKSLDLKRIIIDYHKQAKDVGLADSRDEVLLAIKELFIKKQITIQVKKGKV